MMQKFLPILIVSFVVTACGGNGGLVASRGAPDELRVIDAPPLTLPPNFDLRPPREGEKGKLTVRKHAQQAQQIVLQTDGQKPSQGADWLVKQAGGDERDPDIRLKLDVEAEVEEVEEANQSWFGRVFGKDKEQEQPTVN